MMTRLEIKQVMADFFNIPFERIHDNSTFNDLGLDYIDCFELICELETIYKIDIPYKSQHLNVSVGKLIDSLIPF
jgi:acyl carrier protein